MEGRRGMPKRSPVAELEGQLHLYAPQTYSYAPRARAAVLGLEDGSTWWGEAFGDGMPASGEIVFNTAMTGYQEIASDASYNGQIVVLTYPLIGNYGTFERAAESRRPWVEGLIVRELVGTCREGTTDRDGARDPRLVAGRHRHLQWARRPCGDPADRGRDAHAPRSRGFARDEPRASDPRDLPRPPARRPRVRGDDLTLAVRSSRREPSGAGPPHRTRRDHQPEPRVPGRRSVDPVGLGIHRVVTQPE